MSPELHARKLDEVEQVAARERAKVAYVVGFLREHETTLREAYLVPTDWEAWQVEDFLYTNVTEAMEAIEQATLEAYQPIQYMHPDEASADPLATLGWIQYLEVNDAEVTHDDKRAYLWEPTETGLAIVNGLREVQGYSHLEYPVCFD